MSTASVPVAFDAPTAQTKAKGKKTIGIPFNGVPSRGGFTSVQFGNKVEPGRGDGGRAPFGPGFTCSQS